MLVFLPPSEEYIPALAAYRRICREAGDDMDGSAGLGSFTALSDWLDRVRLLESPAAEGRGWFRTTVFLAVRTPGECSLAAKEAASPDYLPDVVGIGSVRFPTGGEESTAGHIGYHVRPDRRRRGYGSAILTHAAALCRKNGVAAPAVCVLADNLPSLRTALSCGFVREGEGALPTGEPFIRLRLYDAP